MFSRRYRVAVAAVWISAPAESDARIGALDSVVAQQRAALAADEHRPETLLTGAGHGRQRTRNVLYQ